MFGKRLAEITSDDVSRLISDEVPEGAEIEFKKTLPAKDGTDAWIREQKTIGDRARDQIIEEVVAFANAYGGTLVIGVDETKDKPPRASAIHPLPACAELAERLKLQCRDCIEPQIPLLESAGVPMHADGSGVVIIQVPKSRMAPHRHRSTLHCYIRRSDRTEKMSMREIQDLTLHVERGLAALESVFQDHRAHFDTRIQQFLEGPASTIQKLLGKPAPAFGVRCILVPINEINVIHLYQKRDLLRPISDMRGKIGDTYYQLFLPSSSNGNWRPVIRGAHWSNADKYFLIERLFLENGAIEYTHIWADQDLILFLQWFIGLVANCLCCTEDMRQAVQAQDVEYGLEIELRVLNSTLPVGRYGQHGLGPHLGPISVGKHIFPRYSVGSREEFTSLMALVERDFLNLAGVDASHSIEIDFSSFRSRLALGAH